MHITIIANSFQEEYINHLLNNLTDKVQTIDFIGSSFYDQKKINPKINFLNYRGENDEHATFYSKAIKSFKYYFRLLKYLHTTQATIIHFQWFRFYILEGVILTLYIRALGKKIVYTAHDVLPHSKDTFSNKVKFRFVYRVPNSLIAHTWHIKDRIKKEFGINPSKIYVVKHGVYLRGINKEITKERARQYFNLSQSSTVLLFFGIIAEYKGLDILLKSIKELNNNHEFQILIAGKVKPDYKKRFDQLIQDYKYINNIYVLRHIDDDEIEYCFKAADVTVLPYKEASQSGVLFMSYSYGVPVIAPKIGGFPDDIIPFKTVLLFKSNDYKSLAVTLLQFQKEWQETDDYKRNYIKNFAKSNYSWDSSCNELVKIYAAQ